MNFEDILGQFRGVRREAKGWKAFCPAHDDTNPSLSIHIKDGRVLLHCFAGCTFEQVLAAARLDVSDLSNGSSSKRVVAEYDYHDEKGALLFQVVRFEPKAFLQRRPDGNGGWTWDLNNVRRVPYHLPDVLNAESVLIVEGEKDAELACKMGFIGTCNPGGAEKWQEGYAEYFRGKQVCIIADGDAPGRKHAQQVAASLHGKAKTVRVSELPGAKDLSEFVERGGTKAFLANLIGNAPEWKSQSRNGGGLQLTPLKELLSEPEEKFSWVLKDTLPAGGISVVSAKPKVGKSTFARCLALSVAQGVPFLGRDTTQGLVIYLALEEKRSQVRAHFADLGATGEEPIYIHCAAAPQDAMSELCQQTKEKKPLLVIVDPLFKFLRVKDEKAYAEVCAAIEPLLTLARETDTHVMLLHHSVKAERVDPMDGILGSTAIFGGVDTGIILKKSDRYRTIQSCQKYGEDLPETTLQFDANIRALSLGAIRADAEASRLSEQILNYLQECKDPRSRPDIEDHVEGKTGHKRAALKNLCMTGQVLTTGTGSRGDPLFYRIANSTAESLDSCS
jgi:hypothetical protein